MTTTFHCDKLCELFDEHAPRILPWIIERANSGDEFAAYEVTSRSLKHAAIWDAVTDPAKLAELMALALRARGFGGAIYVHEQELHVCWSMTANCTTTQWLTVPQARARLLRIMHTPADPTSRDECERILRGDDGV